MLEKIFKKTPVIKGIEKKSISNFYSQRPHPNVSHICEAPFSSMLFIQSGDVKVCHYNRGISVGSYPEKSLREIWHGAAINEIRQAILEGELASACNDCYKILKEENYAAVPASRYDYLSKYKQEKDYPVMFDFQLTNSCNLECLMCSGEYSSLIRKNREKGAAYYEPWDDHFLEQLKEFIPYLKAASFTGGEPFNSDLYFRIWDLIAEMNPSIDIFISTNATILSEKIKNYCSKLRFNFTVSIDSIVKNTYEEIRKNAVLENTMQNIEWMIQYCRENKRDFAVKCCIIKNNVSEIPDFINFWNNKNIIVYPKLVWFPPFVSLQNMKKEEQVSVLENYKNCVLKNNTVVQKQNIHFWNGVLLQLENWISNNPDVENENFIERSVNDLQNLLTKKILNYVLTECSEVSLEEKYKDLLTEIYSSCDNEKTLKTALIHFLNISPEKIKAELDRNAIDKLKERFKAAGL